MSYHQFSMKDTKARKLHRCIWCGELILKGATYKRESSVFDGGFQDHAWHPECLEAQSKYYKENRQEEFDPHENERPNP